MRKKTEEEEQDSASWLTTYSDMVTLLFAFFVLLFAISNVDSAKFAMLSAAFSGQLDLHVLDQIKTMYGDPDEDMPQPDDNYFKEPDDNIYDHQGEDKTGEGGAALGMLYSKISDYIEETHLENTVSVIHQGEYVLLTLTNDIWFEPGSADITVNNRGDTRVIAQLLSETQSESDPFEVVVVGHTDNVPINTARFSSNWDLSVARAVNILSLLIEESGLDPDNFSARGCGEQKPIADNDTEEGRQMNRRVEVLITQFKPQN